MFKIFLVEDDENLMRNVKEFLEKYDYEVVTVKDYKNIEEECLDSKADLVLMDVNLPYFDGFYFCRCIRKKSNVPIIIISARTSEGEQIMGIEMGADDYITKPFSLQMLLTKVKAVMRRAHDFNDSSSENLGVEGLTLNETSFKMTYKNNTVELSKNEFKLIKGLMEKKDEFVRREDLLELLWDKDIFVDDNTLTVNVTRIKNRLKEIGIINAIKTKRGVGYMFNSKALGNGD